MTIEELLAKGKEEVTPLYMEMAEYAANQCIGCSDSSMILSFKAQQNMLDAHEKGENPVKSLNDCIFQ